MQVYCPEWPQKLEKTTQNPGVIKTQCFILCDISGHPSNFKD